MSLGYKRCYAKFKVIWFSTIRINITSILGVQFGQAEKPEVGGVFQKVGKGTTPYYIAF